MVDLLTKQLHLAQRRALTGAATGDDSAHSEHLARRIKMVP